MIQGSKNVIMVLLVVTVIISLIGTLTAISSLTYREVPVGYENPSQSSGKVSVYLVPSPIETTGKVTVNVLDSENGG